MRCALRNPSPREPWTAWAHTTFKGAECRTPFWRGRHDGHVIMGRGIVDNRAVACTVMIAFTYQLRRRMHTLVCLVHFPLDHRVILESEMIP